MHFRGFVIVDELSEDAVNAAMAPFQDKEWDWWRIGGRYDGYFEPEDVAKARETSRGFNFDAVNEQLAHNNLPAKDVPADRRSVYFFVEGGGWSECERWVKGKEHAKWEGADGGYVEYPDFQERLSAALARHPEGFVVVVDAHN